MKLALLFGDYAWNRCEEGELPPGVRRVETWDDVLTALLENKAEP